ncbi:MAG TPA: TolC family protein [Phycisphaerae bacterium]|nr:TolC family protein [Phycisphaerae bacterium]
MARRFLLLAVGVGLLAGTLGCHQWFLDEADREVKQLIESRQQAALGETHPVDIGSETGDLAKTDDMYRFVPHPVDSRVPDAFQAATAPRDEPEEMSVEDDITSQPATSPDRQAQVFTLADCLAYAQGYARELQTAKEDLYLSALALSLERHLWTPRFSGGTSFEFADYGQVRDFDRAMTAIAQLAVEQQLPYGGTVTARIIDAWMRDLKVHTTSGETGQMILEADIPLLRGAGRVAYESRYQAERDLIYAVRGFERFRREFLVDIASDYFRLLSLLAQIESAQAQVTSLAGVRDEAQAKVKVDYKDSLRIEADRARVEYLSAQNRVVSALETYDSALDRFKIRLGMSTESPIELAGEDIALYEPDVVEREAVATALKYRLDLLNTLDSVDDARRGVQVARNNLLPDFDFSGSVGMNTDPDKPDTLQYNTERTTWRGMLELEIPLDRKEERNQVRSAWIDLRRAERRYDEFADQVRAEVRRAIRQITLARTSLAIQAERVVINEFRAAQAAALLDTGKARSTRDKVEAENDLRDARNAYANARADYRRTILEFLLASGTLRVGDDGRWVTFQDAAAGAFTPPPEPPDAPD